MPAQPLKYPEPPEVLERGSWTSMLKWFGPGVIMASVSIGSGETLFASRGGAILMLDHLVPDRRPVSQRCADLHLRPLHVLVG